MKDWEKLFTGRILSRGLTYFRGGCVYNLKKRTFGYTAEVEGSSDYRVEIRVRNGRVLDMDCNCPHAFDGHNCKHMAAVLYAIEDAEAEKDTYELAKEYFKLNDQNAYYFNPSKMIENLDLSDAKFLEAKKLIDNGDVRAGKVGIVEDSYYGQCLAFTGVHYKGQYGRSLELTLSRDRIIYSDCYSCYTGVRWGEMCEHLLALFMMAFEYIKKNNPGDYTDLNARRLIEAFRKGDAALNMAAAGRGGKEIELSPRLEYEDYGNLKISFKIGYDRLYVLKDMRQLVNVYDKKESLELGKKASINFATDDFDAGSVKFFEFLRRKVKEDEVQAELRAEKSYYEPETLIRKGITLYGAALDEAYELLKGREVDFNDAVIEKRKNLTITMDEREVPVKFTVSPIRGEEDGFLGVYAKGELPDILEGYQHSYCIRDRKLIRIPAHQAESLKPLSGEGRGSMQMNVGKKMLSEFYYNVLPKLSEIADIEVEDAELIEANVPPQMEYSFYLDAEDGDVTCRIYCASGEKTMTFHQVISGGLSREYRDTHRERQILDVAEELFPVYDAEKDIYSCGENMESIYSLLEHGMDLLFAFGEVHTTAAFDRLRIRKKPVIRMGVTTRSDLLELKMTSDDIPEEELIDVINSYKKKKRFHRLRNGNFISLTDDAFAEIMNLFEDMNVSLKEFVNGKMNIPAYRALYLDKVLEENDSIYAERDKNFRNMVRDFKSVREADAEVPEVLKNTLRNYQEYGFKWLKTLDNYGFGGILADEMGLGKTVQVIAMMLYDKENGDGGTSLVVCPASLVYNWGEEFEKFAPGLKVAMAAGKPEERKKVIEEYTAYDVIITSYDLLKRDIDKYDHITFRYEIIDEAQYIKNAGTAAAKAVKIIKAKTKFALTGTPIENRLSELWSICDYLMPGYLYNYETFRKKLESPIVRQKDEVSMNRLKRMTQPFILRRKKADVIKDLPEKLEEIYYARFEDEQSRLYDSQVMHMKEMLSSQSEDEFGKSKIKILAELMKIRQICCDPSLIFENYGGGSAKLDALMELVETGIEGEHKMLLFSQFTSMLEIIEKKLEEKKIPYYKITGATAKSERIELVKKFNGDTVPVFLISLKAGGTGLNLTGADVVIHYDPWWNVAVQNQATDRAHRIGQTRVVNVYKLIARNTIEEKIVKMQNEKKELAEEILSGETGGIMGMSREELLELL